MIILAGSTNKMESLAFEVWVTINRDLCKAEIIELTKAWENGLSKNVAIYTMHGLHMNEWWKQYIILHTSSSQF